MALLVFVCLSRTGTPRKVGGRESCTSRMKVEKLKGGGVGLGRGRSASSAVDAHAHSVTAGSGASSLSAVKTALKPGSSFVRSSNMLLTKRNECQAPRYFVWG